MSSGLQVEGMLLDGYATDGAMSRVARALLLLRVRTWLIGGLAVALWVIVGVDAITGPNGPSGEGWSLVDVILVWLVVAFVAWLAAFGGIAVLPPPAGLAARKAAAQALAAGAVVPAQVLASS